MQGSHRTPSIRIPRVVAVKRSYDVSGTILALVQQGGEGSHEAPHVGWCLGLIFEEVHGLESRVVVDENQQVLVAGVMRSHKWSCDVRMD
eukprot:2890012-Pleurochrysis_carterae.AAC.1